MKIAKRIVLGLLGTAAITSFLLFALDVYLADQAASHATVHAGSGTTDKADTELMEKAALHTEGEGLTIGTSERHTLYQPQEAVPSQEAGPNQAGTSASQTAGSNQAGTSASQTAGSNQAGVLAKASDPDSARAGALAKAEPSKRDEAASDGDAKKAGNGEDLQDEQAEGKKRNVFQTVTQDYFSDALFIGDSRTLGMLQSHLLPEATYYAKTGIGIGDIMSERIVNEGGVMLSVTDALSRHSFAKVYIMIGINDIARGDVSWFTEQYGKILETICRTQPEAVIYIQGNIPMSYRTQDLGGALNNENLALRNEASRALADSERVFYLDIDGIYADANGNLASSYTRDGLHVSTDYYPLWVDYLLQHAIVR